MSFTIGFSGGKELMEALEELKPSLRKPVMRRSAQKALVPFLDAVKGMAPVAEVEGGALRDSYVIGGPSKLTGREKGRARNEMGKVDAVAYAGTSNPAGKLQEFGTRYQLAQPHARPAWVATREKVLKSFADEMWEDIARTAARAARRAAKSG